MALLLRLRRAGVSVRPFKKGPDYIDAAWLQWASGQTTRNLDTFLMGSGGVLASFVQHGIAEGVNLIEGNRGLYDGFDASGTHSSAALARELAAPVVLVIDATKMTRTAAALVLGCQHLDPAVDIRGVVLNNVGGHRHESILRDAIASACSIPVLGAVPRAASNPLPERHLGLIPPEEHGETQQLEETILKTIGNRLDLDALLSIACSAPRLSLVRAEPVALPESRGLRIGYFRDSAFNFYYPENLEEIERAGATLIPVSPLRAEAIPDPLHALYIGGGFPETHARDLSRNTGLMHSLRAAADAGLPIYAECGGLMLLARSLSWKGDRYPMAGVFPCDVEVCDNPQGHGYSKLRVDARNPFFPEGTLLRGHEFHYSRLIAGADTVRTACTVLRGTGVSPGRDFLTVQKVMAGYTHLHALSAPQWVEGILTAAQRFVGQRNRASV